jgi:iron complex outermembrane receptor protein
VLRVLVCAVTIIIATLQGTRVEAQGRTVSQEVFVTATASPASVERVGQTVVTLTRADLERLGVTWIADALRLAPGVDVRARGPKEIQTDFSVRGATFGQNLVLLDGRRLNDSQSGHHNGDVPATLAGIDRIEIVTSAGSAIHGADALGGTINIITRRDRHVAASLTVGQFGYVAGHGTVQGTGLPVWLAASLWGSRSGGFETGREFATGGASVRVQLNDGWHVEARHVNKAFGAYGFYGPSPSKEWTDQTLVASDWQRSRGTWTTRLRLFVRNHGDHFRWDVNRPGFAENQHRTNAVDAEVRAQRDFGHGARLTLGGGGGGDWVRSTNLGDHEYGRAHAVIELQQPLTTRGMVTAGVRADRYTTFGQALSPSVAFAAHVTSSLRVRASAARGFRVPTFTERFYHDPANLGTATLVAERGWSADAGVDWTGRRWTVSASPFRRWDRDVIDWVRSSPAEVWRSTNVRDVTSSGVDLSATGRWRDASIRIHTTVLRVDAPRLQLLSKYVLEYARYSMGLTAAAPLGAGFRLGVTADHRRRADGQAYTLVGLKLSKAVGRAEFFVDGTNLLNETYREIAGVSMPGRWMTAGVVLK